MSKHHWIGRKPNVSAYGFVYLITNLKTGRMYVGRKFYHSYKKKKRHKESDWATYTSSSKALNEDIKKLGKKYFEFKILKNYKTRGGVVYGEANKQHKMDVLTKLNPKNKKERLFYNAQIGAIRYIPKEW